jgi:hypothetical protein
MLLSFVKLISHVDTVLILSNNAKITIFYSQSSLLNCLDYFLIFKNLLSINYLHIKHPYFILSVIRTALYEANPNAKK